MTIKTVGRPACMRWFNVSAVVVVGSLSCAVAKADEPVRPDAFVLWPVCDTADDEYCVESATMDDADILSGPSSSLESVPLYVNARFLDENSFIWSVSWGSSEGELPASAAGRTFHLVYRTGTLQPLYTQAMADQFRMTTGGDADSGFRVIIEGTLAVGNWNYDSGFSCTTSDCGDDTTVATMSRRSFGGNTQNMALWDLAERQIFGGAYIASNAQTLSPVIIFESYPVPRWYLTVANPHLDTHGDPATGAFTAWVPPNYFSSLETTAVDAVAAGFTVTRTDDDVTSDVAADISVLNEGAYLRIDSLGYSNPELSVRATSVDSLADAGVGPDASDARDAAVTIADAGNDLGTDAAATAIDASVALADAGVVSMDAGAPADMAVVAERDATIVVDAVVAAGDASVAPADDADVAAADAGSSKKKGSGCAVSDQRPSHSGFAFASLLIAAILRRRKRRQSS